MPWKLEAPRHNEAAVAGYVAFYCVAQLGFC